MCFAKSRCKDTLKKHLSIVKMGQKRINRNKKCHTFTMMIKLQFVYLRTKTIKNVLHNKNNKR